MNTIVFKTENNFITDALGRWAAWRAISDRIVNSSKYNWTSKPTGLAFNLSRFAQEMMGVHNAQRYANGGRFQARLV